MRARLLVGAFAVAAICALLALSEAEGLVVHEWGTFTSIAGPDGRAVEWQPLNGPSDLPCFVRRSRFNVKGSLTGTVRMETPVLYFYTPRDLTVDVRVRFHQGFMTEWFPDATSVSQSPMMWRDARLVGTIAWTNVKVSPALEADFPIEPGDSHYYTARKTDAAPLQVGTERERFLFYRGVGMFTPPISARVTADGKIDVRSTTNEPLGDIILFENRGGAMAYEARRSALTALTFDPLSLEGEASSPAADLVRILVANGLYQREAEAMVETWRDSWFEEGARLIYVAPRSAVDAVLPLSLEPEPASVERVFVGRMELMTAATKRAVATAIARHDRATLAKYGRFLNPIAKVVGAEMATPGISVPSSVCQ